MRKFLTMAGLVTSLTLAPTTSSASAATPVFVADASGMVTFFPCDPVTGSCPNTAIGYGHASGVGPITVTSSTFRVGPLAPCAPIFGTRTITAASGSLVLSSSGTACLNGGDVADVDLTWVVTGGTGAFARATGAGTETAEIARTPIRELFSGTLNY